MWQKEIETALVEAKVAVLLVSAEFLASSFIAQFELPVLLKKAEEGKLTLLSVVLRPCLFDETPLIKFQAWPKPLSELPKAKGDAMLGEIARTIANALLQANEPKASINL